MKVLFLPALYQPPSPWFPGGKYVLDEVFTPALQNNMGGKKGYLPGSGPVPQEEDMDDRFTPALMERGDGHLPGRTIDRPWDCPNWLDQRLKDTTAYYPHALIAYPHWKTIEHRPFPKEGFLMGDSGGFTVMTLGVNIDPREVLLWQVRERCSAGMILDVPPVSPDKERIFTEALKATCENVRAARSLYIKAVGEKGRPPFKWWGVVHGWEPEELETWWKAVRNVYPFTEQGEGWGFKPRPNITPLTTARVMGWIKKHPEVKRAHFLMTTGVDAVAVLMCLGERAGLEFVTYDSTTFTLNATNRLLQTPAKDGLSWETANERKEQDHLRRYLIEKCTCASCEAIRGDVKRYPDILEKNTGWTGYWVFRFAYHNLLCMLKVFAAVRELSKDDPDYALKQILGHTKANNVMKAFEGRYVFKANASVEGGGLLDHLE